MTEDAQKRSVWADVVQELFFLIFNGKSLERWGGSPLWEQIRVANKRERPKKQIIQQ